MLCLAAHLASELSDGHLEAASWLRLQRVLLLLLLLLQCRHGGHRQHECM
jgi:hypothetical protein